MPSRAFCGACVACAVALSAGAARAQDEVIEDPLASSPPLAPPPSQAAAPAQAATPSAPEEPLFHAHLASVASVQTSWDDLPGGRKDVLESRSYAELSASRGTDRFKWAVGARFDFWALAPHVPGKPVGEPAYLVQARPWETFVDVALGERARLKVGNQIVAWGRLDVGSAGDMLGAYDLRQGPTLDPDALRIPTPTALFDWTPVDALQIDVGYTPFFTPSLVDVYGTNYSIAGPNVVVPGRAFAMLGALDPSTSLAVQHDLATLNGPSPRPDNGEAAARATWRTSVADLSVSYGFLRSKVPDVRFDPALLDYAQTQDLGSALALQSAIQRGAPLVSAVYGRYHQLTVDAEAAVGHFTLDAEAGWSPQRPLYVSDPSSPFPITVRAGLAQAGGKVSYAKDETFAVSLESSVFGVTTREADSAGSAPAYLFFGGSRLFALAFLSAHEELGAHAIDLGAIGTTSGPSLSAIGRYGYRVSDPLVVGVGAMAFAGPRREAYSIANLQRGLDNVFLFVDWRP